MKKVTKSGKLLRTYGISLLQVFGVVIVVGILITLAHHYL